MYREGVEKTPGFGQRIAVLAIKGYRVTLSPVLGNQCRFYPSCSHYVENAILQHGVLKGMLLGGFRILKCNPFHPGGVDLVPQASIKRNKQLYEPTKNT